MSQSHYLPSRVNAFFRRLDIEYERSNKQLLHEIISAAKIAVLEDAEYDNWNGGTSLHDILLFLPPKVIAKISLTTQEALQSEILDDLRRCGAVSSNEGFRAVLIQLLDDADPVCQRAMFLNTQPDADPAAFSFWLPDHLRVFISHRDSRKTEARLLADALKTFGVSAFVAHDTIEPMSKWQHQIEAGLQTMEVLLAFVTDDFEKSAWTNQELGYALGKNIPILSVKLETRDPPGFIADQQALKARLDQPDETAKAVYKLLIEKLGQKDRLQASVIASFGASPHWGEARDRFDRMVSVVRTISDSEFEKIKLAYHDNDQLHSAIYLDNQYRRLQRFLEKTTGKEVVIEGRSISFKKSNDDIPF